MKIQCPNCKNNIIATVAEAGVVAPCPHCGAILTVPDKSRFPAEEVAQFKLEYASNFDGFPVDAPFREFAMRHGIDLIEKWPESVETEEDLAEVVRKFDADFKVTRSAYRPSGKVSAKALLLCPVFGLISIPFGVVAGVAAVVLGIAIIALIVMVLGAITAAGIPALKFMPIPLSLIIFLVILGTPLAIGFVTALFLGFSGSSLGSRSSLFLSILAMVSCFATSAVMPFAIKFCLGLISHPLAGQTVAWFENHQGVINSFVGIWAVGASIVASVVVTHSNSMSKYCEPCDEPMELVKTAGLSIIGAKILAAAASKNDFEVLGKSLQMLDGDFGNIALTCCPKCKDGFLEVEACANLSVKLIGEDLETREFARLIASTSTYPELTDWLAGHFPRQVSS